MWGNRIGAKEPSYGRLIAANFAFAFLCLAILLSHSHGEEFFKSAKVDKSASYPVSRVVDGDTIVIKLDGAETKVRLIGVDTPETVHPQKQVEVYGKEASRFTENLLKGEQVYLEYEPGGDRLDKYGRLLAYVYRAPDGLFVNLEIIRQGYGHAYTKYPFQYMEQFRKAERKARDAQKGLWGIDPEKRSESKASDLKTLPLKESTPGLQLKESRPPQPAAKEQAQTIATVFHGNQKSRIFHKPSCRYYNCSNCTAIFKSKEEALNSGYRPCKICRP